MSEMKLDEMIGPLAERKEEYEKRVMQLTDLKMRTEVILDVMGDVPKEDAPKSVVAAVDETKKWIAFFDREIKLHMALRSNIEDMIEHLKNNSVTSKEKTNE